MLRKTLQVLALGGITFSTLIAGGCGSSGSKPYGVSGSATSTTFEEEARWSDSKGHYHPEWEKGINTPPGYPRG
jgi:hypothetical protein